MLSKYDCIAYWVYFLAKSLSGFQTHSSIVLTDVSMWGWDRSPAVSPLRFQVYVHLGCAGDREDGHCPRGGALPAARRRRGRDPTVQLHRDQRDEDDGSSSGLCPGPAGEDGASPGPSTGERCLSPIINLEQIIVAASFYNVQYKKNRLCTKMSEWPKMHLYHLQIPNFKVRVHKSIKLLQKSWSGLTNIYRSPEVKKNQNKFIVNYTVSLW